MTKRELWRIFMKTGKVSDYINYKNARDEENIPFSERDISEEFAREFINNFDSDFLEMPHDIYSEYSDKDEDFSDYDY